MDSTNLEKSEFVKVNVSNSRNDSVAFELKFAKDITISQLKRKLEIVTGGCADSMKLELFSGEKFICLLDNNEAKLGFYPINNGMRINVVDNFIATNDVLVEKLELSEEQYAKKDGTLRKFLQTNRLGKYNETERRQQEEKYQEQMNEMKRRAEFCTIGSRCQVTVSGNPIRRGTIKYKGPLEGKNGIFIGVQYDEPLGKNDGSFNGKQYFKCNPNYGGFVSPLSVEAGDFPLEDCELNDEI